MGIAQSLVLGFGSTSALRGPEERTEKPRNNPLDKKIADIWRKTSVNRSLISGQIAELGIFNFVINKTSAFGSLGNFVGR